VNLLESHRCASGAFLRRVTTSPFLVVANGGDAPLDNLMEQIPTEFT
jgi:hypothetical protein